MRRRLLLSTTAIALVAILVLGVPLGLVGARLVRTQADQRLEREADAASAVVEDQLEHGRPVTAGKLASLARFRHRITVVDRDGRRSVVGPLVRGPRLSVASGAAQGGRVIVTAPASEVDKRVHDVWLVIGALAIGGLASAALLALSQGRAFARPLERLATASARLGRGDFSARAGRYGVPEIDAAAEALDVSAGRVARMVTHEREYSANVAHQLRTPLAALRLRLDELEALAADDPARAEARRALEQAERLEAVIADLGELARSGRAAGEAEELDLANLATLHAEGWRAEFRRAHRALTVETRGAPVAVATPGAVGQALDVLLENALRHGSGRVSLSVDARNGHSVLGVADEGPGVPAGSADRIFRRQVSLQGGSGLGLALARALIEGDGGRLVLAQAQPPRFELRLRSYG